MTLREFRRHAGQLLIAGFDGVDVPVELRALAREFDLGGTILFARNVVEPTQVAELAYELRGLSATDDAWVSVDQEGGRVARLKAPFTAWPPMATLGRARDASLAARFARALAAELKVVGITLDYAPVVDVHTNPSNPVIGDRALSDDAAEVARLGRVIIETLQGEGIAASAKHFPGHGDTSTDSHVELPIVEHDRARLDAVEFVPFRAAVEADVATIMTAHVLVPALDEVKPATLSSAIVEAVLKGELGFEGVVLSDDLDMKAISGRYAVGEAAVAAIAAGCDAFLICGGAQDRQAEALESVIKAAETGALALTRLEDALRRGRAARERFIPRERQRPLGPETLRNEVGRLEYAAIAEEMAGFA